MERLRRHRREETTAGPGGPDTGGLGAAAAAGARGKAGSDEPLLETAAAERLKAACRRPINVAAAERPLR